MMDEGQDDEGKVSEIMEEGGAAAKIAREEISLSEGSSRSVEQSSTRPSTVGEERLIHQGSSQAELSTGAYDAMMTANRDLIIRLMRLVFYYFALWFITILIDAVSIYHILTLRDIPISLLFIRCAILR